MIFLDTNAVYYAGGFSKSDKCDVRKILLYAQDGDLCISSITMDEILFHYRKQAKMVRRIFSFLRCNNIRIISHSLSAVNEMTMSKLSTYTQKDVNNYYKSVLPQKADIEGRYAFAMFFCVLTAALFFQIQNKSTINDVSVHLMTAWTHAHASECTSFFKNAFRTGYKIDNCENYVKDAFEGRLFHELSYLTPILLKLSEESEINLCTIFESPDLEENINHTSRKMRTHSHASQYIKVQLSRYKKKTSTKEITEFFDNMDDVFKRVF